MKKVEAVIRPDKVPVVRKALQDIGLPGVTLTEMDRIKEYAWCGGSCGGVIDSNPDFAEWTAAERLEEAAKQAEERADDDGHDVRHRRQPARAAREQVERHHVVLTQLALQHVLRLQLGVRPRLWPARPGRNA